MESAIETAQMLTMVVLIGFTSPVDGRFAPVSYSFYQATPRQCAEEQARNHDDARRILCLDKSKEDRRTMSDMLREVG
ncbi:hypothetical protein KAJ83_17105 [Marivibrio halodurans]|uniref:Uncharacterized protein n=1 Tax=Marivibrio halodurans TaxID=2039722 RepID=A0A8J7S1V9_9PROT|nr:hypothetical protein [Marivibrio halodurans]MBP5858740.1 hypothetical protein [Marivibrio halodurans]